MTPDKFLARANAQLKSMKEMKAKHVAVGVLANKATGRVYKNGVNVLQVAAIHEFGLGNSPQRSFLRMPQEVKRKQINAFINKQAIKIMDGDSVNKGLGLIGTYAVNVSLDAFDSSGFGKWPDLDSSTVKAKGSSKALIDKGILKNSISYEVR